MPYAFQSGGGIMTGTITQLILIVIVGIGMGILTYCTHVSGAQSFQQLVRFFAGQKAATITSITIILYSYGACLTFIIIIGDQGDRVLASLYGPDFCQLWYLSRSFTMTAVSLLLILPMSFSRSIDFLKYSRSVFDPLID
jgi:sodium-coupled neutral amino acid transporter 7/8